MPRRRASRRAEETGAGRQTQAAALASGRRLFAQECRFVAGAARIRDIPEARLPEVAFAGRSNVGKSSLINALAGRRGLARVSRTPGRTRQLNFFDLGSRLMIADLPGYGYAEASAREAAQWRRLTEAYLRGRPSLRRLYLLIDARQGLTAGDREVMKRLDSAAVSFAVVLTKADKLAPSDLAARRADIAAEAARHPAAFPVVFVTSARTGEGVPELRAEIARFAR